MNSRYKTLFFSCAFALIVAPTIVLADPMDIVADHAKSHKEEAKKEKKDEVSSDTTKKEAVKETKKKGYGVGSGDKLKITIFGENDLSDTYTVSPAGTLSFPLIDEVQVEGLTLSEVKKLLAQKLSNGYLVDPSITIEMDSYRPFYILGEVRAPGSYNYISDMNILNAVALAGGYTYRANKKNIEIMRTDNGETTLLENQPSDSEIIPGDIVLIKERFF